MFRQSQVRSWQNQFDKLATKCWGSRSLFLEQWWEQETFTLEKSKKNSNASSAAGSLNVSQILGSTIDSFCQFDVMGKLWKKLALTRSFKLLRNYSHRVKVTKKVSKNSNQQNDWLIVQAKVSLRLKNLNSQSTQITKKLKFQRLGRLSSQVWFQGLYV